MTENNVGIVFDMSRYYVPRAVEDPWQALADAVVCQAAKDYRNALHGIGIGRKHGPKVKKECERFFRSEWFTTLSNLDGNKLLDMLTTMQEDAQ